MGFYSGPDGFTPRAYERDRVQKKTFTKWVNKHLIKVRKHITDLYEDLRDGHNLISLLEVLSGVTLPREKGRMRFHRLQNVQIALDFLKQRQVKLVNIRNDDITDGNPKLTLGLIWTIILHFQISEIYVSGESGDLTAKEKLLLWTQQATEGYPGLRCSNFTSSWSNGRLFNALLHRYRPDLIDMEVVTHQSNRDNLEQAFEIAESLGVTRLLDAEDVDVPSPDEKSVITYVASIYDAFPKIPEGGEGIPAHEVDQRWSEYQTRFSSLMQWSRKHTALMADKNFPQNPVELKALYNQYIHFKETEIPIKEMEKSRVEHLYKLLEVWIEFGRIKLPQGIHPNELEVEWGKLILEMLDREKALRPAVDRVELLLQMANKIQNTALDCEEKLTLAKNTLQADMSRMESGEGVQCEGELACYLQDCEGLIRQLNQDVRGLREERYYQVDQLASRVSGLQEELVSLRLQCSSVYRKGHFSSQSLLEQTAPRPADRGLSLGQTLLGAVGAVGAVGAALLRRPMARSQLVAMSSSEDEGSLRFIYELLGWVEETQDLLEGAEWGADLPSVENNLQEHNEIHTAVQELLSSIQEARNYQGKVSPNFKNSYCETMAKLEHQYCKLLERSSWRLRSLESLHGFVTRCTEELIWLNEREEEEMAYDWGHGNTSLDTKKELYTEMRSELDEKQDMMQVLQETADRLCQENHPAKQTVEAYSAALQTQWQWVRQLCVCVEQHLKDNAAYFQFMNEVRDCESYLRQLQDTIKRQYTCDRNSRLGKLEDLLQDSMEEKEQLIEYRRSVASLVGRAKAVVQLRPRSTDTPLGAATPIRAICDYRQIEITISRGEECVLEDNSQRTKWKVISPSGNEAMVPSVCFTVPPPNQEAIDTASRMEQMYQKVMSLWHQLHMNMKSVVSWHYLTKDLRTVSAWSLDTMRSQSPPERDQALDELESHLADFLSDSKESALFTPAERSDLEKEAQQAQKHCQDLLLNMETVEKDESVSRSYLSELRDISLHLEDVERRLTRAIQTPPLSHLSGDGADGTARITEQEKMQAELEALQSSVGEVSRRCVGFFQDKPTSSSVPAMRSELSQAVEKMDKLYNLSHVFLQKLKTVDVLMSRLGDTEEVVRKYESRLSDEDTVPADTTAMQVLQEQLASWQGELSAQDGVLRSLQAEVERAREAGSQLARLHPDRSSELERYQERANQMAERWSNVERQMETRRADLEVLGSSLQQYKDGHSGLISWIEETTERQENTQPGQMDSKALSEQLAQQTALVVEIEANQTKLDQCQINAKQYCTSVKDYELQLMTYRAFVESTHKSSLKRRRMHSSSDAISQEFMDLRTRYTALVTLTTQHVKYISDALRRIEEEEKEVEEEMQARVGPVSDLLGWVKGLQGRSLGPNAESSLAAQQAVTEQLSARKEEVAEAIRSTQVFLQSKQASKLSPEESARVRAQLEELTSTYSQLCDSSSQQLRKMEHQLAKEEEEKKQTVIAGIIDMGSMEIFSVFSAAQCGLIDQETCRFLLEAQLISGGLLQPPSPQSLSLEHALAQGMIDNHTSQSLSYLERALHLVNETKSKEGEKQCLLPVAIALEEGVISEHLGLHILEVHMNTGGLRYPSGELVDLDTALEQGLLPSRIYIKLQSQLQRRELIDPNTAERLSLSELQQRCISHEESGLHLLPVKQQSERTVSLRSGRKVGIFRASQEGLVDQNVTVRLLEAQLFAGGIVHPRSGNRLILDEALSQGLMHQNQACTILARQLQTGGILDPRSGERLGLDESLRRDLLSPSLALLVLESLQSFMGMLWPESGELVPIAEALQQGGVSEDLARNVLGQRHVVGALYDVGALHLVPLSQTSEKALDLSVAKVLSKIHIPDVLPSTPSSPPSTNRISWCSTSSSPSPSSQPPGSLTTGHVWDSTPLDSSETQEQAKHVLLSHLMTHSYVDVHSGKRLVLLDAELVELVKATGLSCADTSPGYQVQEEGSSLIAGSMQTIGSIRTLVYSAEGEKEETAEVVKTSCQAIPKVVLSSKIIERKGRTSQESKNGVGDRALQQTSNQKIEPSIGGKGEKKIENVTAKGEIEIAPRSENFAGKPLSQQVNKSDQHKEVRNKEGSSPSKQADTSPSINQDNATSSVVNTERVYAELEQDLAIVESSKTIDSAGSQAVRSMGYAQIVQKSDLDYKSQFINRSSETNKTEEEAEMERLTIELKQGGLLTEEGDRLLPDEAVAQGILPGQTAVKLMSQAGLFGGFLDATSGELLSLEDVMQEDLLDEDLMWSVLKSDKSLSGVVDIDKGNVCGLREAAQKGLIDSNTASRLLEAQVLSGGIVDLNRDEKVSVTLAANLGLIEEDQKESLEALENAYKGKATEPQTAIAKATIQLQMEGIVDPESRSPVPLECAIQKGLIGSEEAYQALSKQVAEGGILHHASGTRLSVSDALERGLVDRSLAPGLEELQCVYKGNISLLAHPEAALFQASTGAIYSPESGRKLTLTEAVSKGLLEEKVAKEAMASDSVTQGVIDPQSCRIVPYSHLVHQGKIDLNTGKRFLEVKQFSGIQDEQTGDILTLKQAIAIGKVDPVPALRLLQSQADSGGIIDITSGDRLPLPEASEKGLIEEDMAREIAINQITKGGLIHPTTGQRVANLDDAIIAGLISSEMAFDIQESMTLAEIDEGEGSSTSMVSSNSAYSPGADSSVASNQVKWSSESSLSTTPLLEQSGIGLVFKEVDQKQLDSLTSNQLSLCDATLEEDTVEQPLSESDSSIDLLAKFASNVGKRIQQAINEIKPQKAELKQGPGEASSIRERHAFGTRKESDYTGITAVSSYQESDPETFNTSSKVQVAEQVTITRSVDLSVRADKKKTRPADVRVLSEHHEDENDERMKDAKADDVREEGKLKESLGVDVLSLKQLEHEYTEQCDEAGKREIGGELEDTAETILTGEGTDVKHSDQSLTASDKEAEAKSKKKKKSKKKGRGKESENKPLPLEKSDNVSDIKQMDSENEGQSQVTKSITGVSPLPVKVKILESTPERDLHVKDGELKIDGKVDAAEVSLVSQDDQQANDNGGQPDMTRAEIVRKQMEECVDKQYGKTEMGVSVQKGAKRPEKSNLPDNEKAALIMKAKESILKKVFEKGVTEKQAAEELEALRKEVHRKDIQAGNARDGKMQTPVIKMETPSRKMATPLTKMVDVEGSTDEDDHRKMPDAKPKVEWKGETGGRKENLKVDVKEVVVVDEPNLTDDSSLALKEAKTLSKEKDDCVGGVKEGKDKETVSPDQHKENPLRKMVTPLTEMVDVEGSTDEDDLRKPPDAKTTVEWMGKTGGRKEENLKVNVKEVVVVDEPNLTDDSSLALKKAKTLSKEKDDCVGGVKEGKDKETVSPDQHKETLSRKMVTPLTEMVDVEGSTDEDDFRKRPDAKTKVEWMGKTSGRKEENLKVDVKEVVVVDEPNLTDDSSLALKEAKTISKEKDDCVGDVKEGKDKETVSPDKHKETPSRKMVTPLTEMVNVEGSTDEDDLRKWPDAKPKVEWMGKAGGRKEENLKVDVKEALVVAEPKITDDSSLAIKEAKTLSKEADDRVCGVKEGKQTVSPDQHKETRQGKRQKKNKKSKIAKIAGHADAATEKPWTDDAVQAVVTATICTKKTGINVERKADDQKGESLKYVKSESDVDRPSSSDDTNKMASSTVDAKTTNEVLQRPIRASAPAIEKAKAEVKSAREEFKGPLKVIESKSVEEIKEALQMTGKQSAGDEFKRSLHSSFIKSGGEEVKEHIQIYVSDTVREEMKEPLKMGGINSTEEKLKEALQMTVVKEMKEPVHIAEIKSAAEEMKGPLGLTGNQSAGEEVKKHVQKAGIGYVGEVIKEPIPLAGMTSIGKELKEHQLNIKEQLHPAIPSIAADVFGTTYEAVDNKSLQPDSRSVDSMKQDPNLFESPLPSQTGNKRHPESLLPSEENPTESELAEVLESDTTTESSGEGEEDKEEIKMKKKKGSAKSSLIRQECLEHDQRIVALVSMVRHIEVCLKQQQQQSVGRGLISLEDIIRQTEALSLELQDLEPEVNKEVEATAQLLEPRPSNVPPQLLLALEKDMRSLARGYESARGVSETILQGLREHRDSFKEAVTAEQKNLGGLVENLLTWLSETEARSIGAMAGKEEKDSPVDQITQQLEYCKEFQAALTARSNEVIDAAFDVQVFISERAQDLAPEQSRHLLGQLQRLQGAFHQASGQARARAETLSNQRAREEELQQKESAKVQEEEKEREIERQTARKIEVVKQQKAECSQKLEGLNVWLAGAASMLANQKACVESGDVDVLQEKQKELKEVQKDLQSKAEGVAGTIRSVEDFLSERGDCLSPEERESLQGALRKMKEHYADLTNAADASVTQLDTAISTTLQQNTQRAKAEEDLQETRGQIDAMLEGLSSLSAPAVKAAATKCSTSPEDVIDGRLSSTQPEGALQSHTDMLQAEMQQLQAQQAQLLQVAQSTRSLLEQPDSAVPPEEKRRLRASLDQLQAQHQSKLQSCQDRLRKSEVLRDELSKFLQEHGGLGTWLDQSEKELRSLGEGETDAQGLKGRLEEHKKLAEEVICHKADLRFVSISGQKVLDSVQGALEQAGGSDPALDSTKQLVTDKLHDANHRYTALHTKSSELGGRLSGLLERSQQYQDEAVSLHSWLSSQEQERDTARPSGDTNPQNLQSALRQVQLLQDELAARSVQLEKVKRAGRELVSTEESPSLKAVDILCTADGLERRFDTLSASVSERAEQLQTAVAQSVSVQEGLKGLLSWLDQLVLSPGPVQPTAQAVQDAMTQNQKLRQELLSRQGSVDATRDSLSKLLQSADAATASDLQGALAQLNGRYAAAQASQTEREAELKVLLPRLESYERLGADLQGFTQSRLKALGPVGQPEHSVDDYRQTLEEVKSDLEQEAGQLKSFCELGTDLSQSQAISNSQSLLDNVKEVSDEFSRLEANVNDRFSAIQGCEQRLAQFRGLSGSLLRWLQASQDQLPAKEPSLDTEGMQRRVQQLQDLCDDWESQGARVQELNKTGSELESTIIGITAPQTKTGAPQMNGSANPGSVNGIHTCKDLTELQVAVAEVNGRYESLGSELKERHGRQQAALELRQQASQGAQELSSWLRDREHSLEQGHNASPSKPEVVRAKAQENKALLRELTEHSGKVEELKASLTKLVADNPDSPEAASWRQQLQELDSRWQKANETAAQRQTELETCADRLGSFATAASQLGPWLREKELMMSVLGPLSIDPNMLNTQKQQVQFMLREFDTRRPQYDELTQSAEGILSQSGDAPQDPKDLQEVRAELGSISKQWEDLTSRLDLRSGRIDRAQGTSERYQALLKELAASVGDLGERLDGQASLSAQPEALRSRLQETGEVRSELELRRAELGEAERLCEELSAIVDEPYLREELSKRLEAVGAPLRSLEERAADGLSQLQAALSSTQQFQQMFDELRCWLDNQADTRDSSADSLPCQPEALRSLLAHAEDLQRGIAAQRGSYELLQAEGASLLAALPAGGDERSALQSRLSGLRQDWDGQNQRATDRQNRLKSTLAKAETYQKHRAELVPWLEECEGKDVEIRPSLDPAALDEALQRARTLSMDLDRRRPLVDALNTAADQLLEQCRVGEEEVRDEKAQLNRRVDGLGERVHDHTSQLEELAGRLKEFQEGRQSVERRLDAAKHQIEVQEALGPQACSAKSLERLRSQQEALRSLQPQVVYLRDLAQGLVQDAPQTPGGGREGAERLQQQATDTEKEYEDVTEKVEQCSAALESRLQGVGEVQTHVRDVFSRLADLDDELDSLSPVGRDGDSLASQAEALRGLLARVGDLRHQLDGHGTECTAMLRREGSSPDLLALRRETEALSRQAGKLNERGQVRLGQIEDAAEKVREFYGLVAELQGMLGRAEEGLNAQGLVGTEVEIIKQQLQEFKALEREQVDGIQPRLKHVNAVGQGLIQSAAKHTDTQALEHDLENTNLQWNSLNKRVAERIAQLQEALLHCGKFQDALEPLLSWLSDTEELVANQKPPSAEYRVVKAQIQEQKLLQRLLDDRRPTVQMIQAEGERIAATADAQDRDKIQSQLQSLGERWTELLDKASG
ncbi:unnamed protein product, partial [Gadus morhua 'NCC']